MLLCNLYVLGSFLSGAWSFITALFGTLNQIYYVSALTINYTVIVQDDLFNLTGLPSLTKGNAWHCFPHFFIPLFISFWLSVHIFGDLRSNEKIFYSGMMEWWNDGMMKLWKDVMIKGWNDGMMELWNYGIMELWNDGIMEW